MPSGPWHPGIGKWFLRSRVAELWQPESVDPRFHPCQRRNFDHKPIKVELDVDFSRRVINADRVEWHEFVPPQEVVQTSHCAENSRQ